MMKYMYRAIAVIFIAFIVSSCGGQQKEGTKFAPNERTSALNENERKEAIAQKRSELNGLNLETLLYTHDIKFSIIEPEVQGEDITKEIANQIAVKMLQIASQNGISGLGTNPIFALGSEIVQTNRTATSTVPQKMTVQYDFTFKALNVVTGEVYATAIQTVTGVGRSFQEANQMSVREIKNTPELQKMLQTASSRIIDWYNNHLETLKNQVAVAESKGDVELALAIVEAVPEQAANTFKYAKEVQPELLKKLKQKYATESLSALKAAIAEAKGEFSPIVAGCLQMIPEGTNEAKQAQMLYAEYEKVMKEKAIADNKAKELEAQRTHEKELAQIEADKLKCKYEQMANAKALEKAMRYDSDQKNKGFWGKLGNRILGGIDYVGDKVSDSEWDN